MHLPAATQAVAMGLLAPRQRDLLLSTEVLLQSASAELRPHSLLNESGTLDSEPSQRQLLAGRPKKPSPPKKRKHHRKEELLSTQGQADNVEAALMLFARANGGDCPRDGMSTLRLTGVKTDIPREYTFGFGCNYKSACGCPHSVGGFIDLYDCATAPRWGGDTGGYQKLLDEYPLVPIMGFCQFSTGAIILPILLISGCCIACCITGWSGRTTDVSWSDIEEEEQQQMRKKMKKGKGAGWGKGPPGRDPGIEAGPQTNLGWDPGKGAGGPPSEGYAPTGGGLHPQTPVPLQAWGQAWGQAPPGHS